MASIFGGYLYWLPPGLHAIALGAFALFFFLVILRVVSFIKNLIPFL